MTGELKANRYASRGVQCLLQRSLSSLVYLTTLTRCLATGEQRREQGIHKDLKHAYVRHGAYKFTKIVKLGNHMYQAGTQTTDSVCGNLDMALSAKRGVFHKHLPLHVRTFQWRMLVADADPLKAFADAVNRDVELHLLQL